MASESDFHNLAELRSWALHAEVARRLNPELLARARARVQTWMTDAGSHPYAERWARVLHGDTESVQRALLRADEEMCTLRQASPFAGALDAKTRWAILKRPELRPRATR